MNATLQDSRVEEVEDRILQALDEVINFWGFKGVHGRIWGLLFLSPEPLTMEQIQERLGISAGAVSVTLKELRSWGVAHRERGKEERKARYRAETNFWKMISRVLDDRERRLVDRSTSEIADCAKEFQKLARSAGGEEAKALRHRAARSRQMVMFGGAALSLLEAFLHNRKVDASPLAKLAALPQSFMRTFGGSQ